MEELTQLIVFGLFFFGGLAAWVYGGGFLFAALFGKRDEYAPTEGKHQLFYAVWIIGGLYGLVSLIGAVDYMFGY